MSYDLTIHRGLDDWGRPEHPISREEWAAWVENAPDFRFDETSYLGHRDESGEERKDFGALWTEHPDGDEWDLFWMDGVISTGNPDEHVLRRMARIAQDLGAHLQGDDGEFYGPDGERLPED